jgi:8-oxo-dGTP pyrophosphatase MutT (NUDIX family)
MEIETRRAALCIIHRENAFLIAEIQDPKTGLVLHRPPGGGIEEGESPEQAVRRELHEELGIQLTVVEELGEIDHVWFWNGREIHERVWLFSANSSDDDRLNRGETPDLVEANGQQAKTFWRPNQETTTGLPPLCPSSVLDVLARKNGNLMVPNKACPIVFRDASFARILVFRHPLAGIQLVKGTIEPGENPAGACLRELCEESGICDARVDRNLGVWETGFENQVWSLHLCLTPSELPESWVHRTQDDNGLDLTFYWHSVDQASKHDWHPLYQRALLQILRCLHKS